MLYNPSWNTPDLSIAAVADWLAMQPAERTYEYINPGNCLIAQYLRWLGYSDVVVGACAYSIYSDDGEFGSLPRPFPNNLWAVAAEYPRTFGAALQRARAYLDDQNS